MTRECMRSETKNAWVREWTAERFVICCYWILHMIRMDLDTIQNSEFFSFFKWTRDICPSQRKQNKKKHSNLMRILQILWMTSVVARHYSSSQNRSQFASFAVVLVIVGCVCVCAWTRRARSCIVITVDFIFFFSTIWIYIYLLCVRWHACVTISYFLVIVYSAYGCDVCVCVGCACVFNVHTYLCIYSYDFKLSFFAKMTQWLFYAHAQL